jgi:secreted trypsin-like serine protease
MFVLLVLAAIGAFANAAPQRSGEPATYAWSDSGSCGISPVAATETQIVGGQQAQPNQFPWQVSMRRSLTGSHFCGGSVITPNYVLTAAHCTDGQTAGSIEVAAGEHTRSAISAVRQLRDVTRITQHNLYNSATTDYDASILTLSSALSINAQVLPVCPPASTNKDDYIGRSLVISGWGTTSSGGSCCPDTLLWTTVTGLSTTSCQADYNTPINPSTITARMICAAAPGRDTCQGDSGGPMVWRRANGQYELVGLTSWGRGCADPSFPGVYANVPLLQSWVDANTP